MDLFSTNRLVAQVDDLRSRPAPRSLLSMFFPRVIEETSEEIHFDVETRPRRIAPYVHPTHEGKLVESQGFSTTTIKPAYVKDKRVFDGTRPLKRIMGEQLTGNLSPEQRQAALLAMELDDQIAMLRRAKEVQAAEALRLGQVTIAGDGFPTIVVSYSRNAALQIDLSGGAAEWGDAGVSPVADLEAWQQLALLHGGSLAQDIVFTPGAWTLFRADANFDKMVDLRRGGTDGADFVMRVDRGLVGPVGTFGGVSRLWLYFDWYVNSAGSEVPIIPDNWVIGVGAIEGQQIHGAIRDEEAGFQATEFWPKSWVQPDPSVRYLMLQSAPLVVPFRINASFAALVT